MNPEGMGSTRVAPSMLAVGWTSAFAVGMSRAVAIGLVQIKNTGEISHFPFLEGNYRNSAGR
jgi:hypothetical protein